MNVRGCFCSDTQVLCSAAQWSLHPLGTKVQNCWDAWWTLPVHAIPTHQLPSAGSCQGEHEHVLFFFFFKGCRLKQVCSTCQHLDWPHLFNPCTLMQCFPWIHCVDVSMSLQGPIMNCTRLAEKAVALVCCEKLHKIGKTRAENLASVWIWYNFSLYLFELVYFASQVSWTITWCQLGRRRWSMRRSWTFMMKRRPVYQAGPALPRGGSATLKP